MQLFTKKSSPPKPKHVEVWGHLVAVNRSLKRLALALAAIALVSVGGMAWAMATALGKPLIYYVDSDGQASFGGRLANASQPLEVEVSYVSKEFLRRTIASNSLTVARDFAESFNLMSARLQQQQQKHFDQWERTKGQSFVDYIRAAQIRSSLDFTTLNIENRNGEQFMVHLKGTLQIWPLSEVGEAEPRIKAFEAHLSLIAVERSEQVPNGLLVSHQTINYFEPSDAAEDLRASKGLTEGNQ